MKSKAHSSQNGRSRVCEVDTIRVVEIDGNPWFVAKDVCLALGFNVKSNGEVNTTHALRNLNYNEFTTHRVSSGRGGAPKIISESGLYKIIMRSDKPEPVRSKIGSLRLSSRLSARTADHPTTAEGTRVPETQ